MLTEEQREQIEQSKRRLAEIDRKLCRNDVRLALERRAKVRQMNVTLEGLGMGPMSLPPMPSVAEQQRRTAPPRRPSLAPRVIVRNLGEVIRVH